MESRRSESARLFSPSAGRNKAVIARALSDILPQGAKVLEIGSGTGEHAAAVCMARPDLTWQPSDPDARSRESQEDWAKEVDGCMQPSISLDPRDESWTRQVGPVDAILCCNVIHISAWSVAQGLAQGAQGLLAHGAPLVLYGPFLEGEVSAPSNLDFDESLRSRNPDWGVRELGDVISLFESKGFVHKTRITMPANNLMLVFERCAS